VVKPGNARKVEPEAVKRAAEIKKRGLFAQAPLKCGL